MPVSIMAEGFTTTLNWQGSSIIAQRLAKLIPEGTNFEIENDGDVAKLAVFVESDGLEQLRTDVDTLLTLFSDQDE